MAIVVESVSTLGTGTRSTLTLAKPTGTVDGELLVAIIGINSANGFTDPAGWTAVNSQQYIDVGIQMSYKIASSEPASWDWTTSPGRSCQGCVLRISGAASTPLDQSNAGHVADSANPSFAITITPSAANSLLIFAAQANQGATGANYAIATSNPTWTEQLEIDVAGGGPFVIATAVRPETSATGNASMTTGGGASTDSVAILASFKIEPNVTVTPAVVSMSASVQAPTITGGAVVTPAVISMAASIQAPTVTSPTPKWTNESKSSPGTITNESKS